MADDKMTYGKALDVVIEGGEMTDEVIEKLKALKTSLAKRNTKPKGESKKAIANKAESEKALAFITENGICTIPQMIKGIEGWGEYTPSKVSTIVKLLVDEGKVAKGKNKGGTVNYHLA